MKPPTDYALQKQSGTHKVVTFFQEESTMALTLRQNKITGVQGEIYFLFHMVEGRSLTRLK